MSDISNSVANNEHHHLSNEAESSGYRTPAQNVSSPQSFRETPGLYTTQQQYKRRPPFEEPSPSALNQKTVSNGISSRSPFLNQRRNSINSFTNSTTNSTPKQHINSSIFPGNNGKTPPYKIAPSNSDKKRLVEQFYNTFNDAIVVQQTDTDFSSFLRHSNFSSVNASPTLQKNLEFDKVIQKDEEFTNLINHGGLTFNSFDNHLINDENLTNYLLNIDTLTDNLQKQDHVDHNSLQPLSDVVDRVLQTFLDPVSKSMTKLDDQNIEAIQTLEDLDNLSNYIRNLSHTTNVVLIKLQKGKKSLKDKYKREISLNIERLNEFIASLQQLEQKLNNIKAKITSNKQFMSTELNEKIAVLEFVNHRFIQHSKSMRYRRLKQLNIGLAVFLCLLAIYYYYI